MIGMIEVQQYLEQVDKPVQLVRHHNEVREKHLHWPAYVQVKYDGVYALVVVLDDQWKIFSRTGKPFYLECKPNGVPLQAGVYIAELMCNGISLEELSGLVNPNRVELWDGIYNMYLMFHDFLSVSDLLKGENTTPYGTRFEDLKLRVPPQHIVWSALCTSPDALQEQADGVIEHGGEGVVLKQLRAPWIAGHKNWHVTKVVRELHVDLECVGVVYGKGKFDGLISALTFMYKGKRFNAGLGKGWTVEKMAALTRRFERDPSVVIYNIWHVSALQESSKGVLRLPKFNEKRIDKDTSD